ncbi:hypothetical protein [Streptomyces sp. NPDC046887]|uniref:hypothetical protein n=1 Tax=Streptomyces sp. NPDC046887 TaxID=3155472 RepID=UPI0033F2A2BA
MAGPWPHRVWGGCAAIGYATAALLGGRWAFPVAGLGAVAVPLGWLTVLGRGQLEVAVVERSGRLLLATGSPYPPDPGRLADYTPYLPGMAVFGALPGDPRWWLGGVFVGSLWVVGRLGAPPPMRWLVICPPVALPLATGGVDLPLAGLMCLGLALAGRGRAVPAGLVLGLAATLKWTAWPALPVAAALLAAREPLGRRAGPGSPVPSVPGRRSGPYAPGRRSALRCTGVALATAAAGTLPALLADPDAFRAHVVDFPLGLTTTASPAASPLPGPLLAAYAPGGTLLAAALLTTAALLLALSLVVRPPRTTAAAAARLALGLALATALMPASRFGYLVHPLVLLATLWRPPCPASPSPWSSPMTSRPAKAASRPSSSS